MSYAYLVRHGRPVLPEDEKLCIGRTLDPELSEEGIRQSRAAGECFFGLKRIYCSSLARSRRTAELMAGGSCELVEEEGLSEINVGEWEGLSFREIRESYPETYSLRGRDWSVPPTGGESLAAAADRLQSALLRLLRRDGGDIVAITHDGAMRALIWRLTHADTRRDAMPRQPYGSITVVKHEDGELFITATGRLPNALPAQEEIEELWDICGTPANVIAHSLKVCDECLELCEKLKSTVQLSRDGLRAAALLHDMCRQKGAGHAERAAALLRERGYLKLAHTVSLHHECTADGPIDETKVLFLADKHFCGAQRVSTEERFSLSAEKCITDEARAAHEARFSAARAVEEQINKELELSKKL